MTTIKGVRCLSVMQPWADLIVYGRKFVENRTFATKYRGPLVIHASKRGAPHSVLDEIDAIAKAKSLDGADLTVRILWSHVPARHGAIVGVVNLVGCDRIDSGQPFENEGAVHWRLADPYVLATPIPIKGALGIWRTDIKTDDEYFARRLRTEASHGDL